jgi:hypothetical protein
MVRTLSDAIGRFLSAKPGRMWLLPLFAGALAAAVTVGLILWLTPPSHVELLMSRAPHAYTGMCEVETSWLLGTWSQPAQGTFGRSDDPTRNPVPCANLGASLGRTPNAPATAAEWRDNNTAWPSQDIWIHAERQGDGSYDLTWGLGPGVQVEWLFALVSPGAGMNSQIVPAHLGHLRWHPTNRLSYPQVTVYANKLGNGAKRGRPVSETGPPAPLP